MVMRMRRVCATFFRLFDLRHVVVQMTVQTNGAGGEPGGGHAIAPALKPHASLMACDTRSAVGLDNDFDAAVGFDVDGAKAVLVADPRMRGPAELGFDERF
jgi:hypothetical protein